MKTMLCTLVCAGAALMLGCAGAKVAKPLTADLKADTAETQLEFWHALPGRPVTSNDEAFHGLLLYLDNADPNTSYAQRVAALKKRDLLPAGFDEPADRAVKRGTLAVAFVRTLKIKGGLMQMLTHDHPRYATRELMYLDLYPPSAPTQTFSGSEFVGIIGRLEDYQRGNPNDSPAKVMPGERDRSAPATQPATRPAR